MNNDLLTVSTISEKYSVCTIKESINMDNDELSKNINRMVHQDNAQKDTTYIVKIKKKCRAISCEQAEIIPFDYKANRVSQIHILL